jgi:hypothetical protein
MGTWGSGNLDSDGALDAIATRSEALVGEVWSSLQRLSSAEADEFEYDQLFADLEWLFALDAAGCLSLWWLPQPTAVDAATAPWLEAWEAYFRDMAGEDFLNERKGVIEETFARFRAMCERAEAQRQGR